MGELVSFLELFYRKAKPFIFGKPCGAGISVFSYLGGNFDKAQ